MNHGSESVSVSNAAPVVYNLTMVTPDGFVGTLTLDSAVDPSSSGGGIDVYEYGSGAISTFSFMSPLLTATFDQTDEVTNLILSIDDLIHLILVRHGTALKWGIPSIP